MKSHPLDFTSFFHASCFKTKAAGVLAVASIMMAEPAFSATVFDENFESSAYTQASGFYPITTGEGVINYGSWSTFSSGDAWVLTTDDEAHSASHSMILDRMDTSGVGNAQVIGSFGYENHNEVIESAISFSMAFRVTDNSAGNYASVAFRDNLGNNVGYAYLSMGGFLQMAVGPGQELVAVGAVLTDQWYVLDVLLPSVTENQYTVKLFGADGTTLLGDYTGAAVGMVDQGYSYFTIGHSLANSALYLDDIRAEAIPEPGGAAMGMIGLSLVGYGLRRMRKQF